MKNIKAQVYVHIYQAPRVDFDDGEEELWTGGKAPHFARPGVTISPGEVELDLSEIMAAIMGRTGLTSDQRETAMAHGYRWRIKDWDPDTRCLKLEFREKGKN